MINLWGFFFSWPSPARSRFQGNLSASFPQVSSPHKAPESPVVFYRSPVPRSTPTRQKMSATWSMPNIKAQLFPRSPLAERKWKLQLCGNYFDFWTVFVFVKVSRGDVNWTILCTYGQFVFLWVQLLQEEQLLFLITISYYFMYLRTVCFSLGTIAARRKHSYSFHKFNKMFQFMNSLYSRHICVTS